MENLLEQIDQELQMFPSLLEEWTTDSPDSAETEAILDYGIVDLAKELHSELY